MLGVLGSRFHIGVYGFIVILLLTGPNKHLISLSNTGAINRIKSIARQIENLCFGNGL